MTAETIKKEDTVSGLTTGMRWVYTRAGHRGTWPVQTNPDGTKTASGNPLNDNPEIRQFKVAHSRRIAALGDLTRSVPPLTPACVVDHGKLFWLNETKFDRRDVAKHAILLVALNCGLRYSEVEKVKLGQVTVTRHGVSFSINETIKNSIVYNEYTLEHWPGDHFDCIMISDPMLALSAWLEVRGDEDGYFFCQINGHGENQRVVHHQIWANKDFVSFMRGRLISCGMAPTTARLFTGNSLKRGCVQLLRALGVKNEEVMRRIKMEGPRAYLRYTEAFNDSAPPPLPGFTSTEAPKAHMQSSYKRKGILENKGYRHTLYYCIPDLNDKVSQYRIVFKTTCVPVHSIFMLYSMPSTSTETFQGGTLSLL